MGPSRDWQLFAIIWSRPWVEFRPIYGLMGILSLNTESSDHVWKRERGAPWISNFHYKNRGFIIAPWEKLI